MRARVCVCVCLCVCLCVCACVCVYVDAPGLEVSQSQLGQVLHEIEPSPKPGVGNGEAGSGVFVGQPWLGLATTGKILPST